MILAAWISFFLSIIVLALKFWAYTETKSVSILSDALETIVNVVASAFALLAVKTTNTPADDDHPYGYGKIEYFSAAFEGGLISFAAIAVFYGASTSIIQKTTLTQLDFGIILSGIAMCIDGLLAYYLFKTAKKYNSLSLKASSSHLISDVLTTLGVIISLALIQLTGQNWIDPLVAILISILLVVNGYKIVRYSIAGLMDEMDPKILKELSTCLNKNRITGLVDVHFVRVIRSGTFHHIDAHLVLPEFWTVEESPKFIENFKRDVVKSYTYDAEIAFHIDPCLKKYCQRCDLKDCPIRQEKFIELRELDFNHLLSKGENLV